MKIINENRLHPLLKQIFKIACLCVNTSREIFPTFINRLIVNDLLNTIRDRTLTLVQLLFQMFYKLHSIRWFSTGAARCLWTTFVLLLATTPTEATPNHALYNASTTKFHHPVFNHSEVIMFMNKQTRIHTHKQAVSVKNIHLLCYTTPDENHPQCSSSIFCCKFFNQSVSSKTKDCKTIKYDSFHTDRFLWLALSTVDTYPGNKLH